MSVVLAHQVGDVGNQCEDVDMYVMLALSSWWCRQCWPSNLEISIRYVDCACAVVEHSIRCFRPPCNKTLCIFVLLRDSRIIRSDWSNLPVLNVLQALCSRPLCSLLYISWLNISRRDDQFNHFLLSSECPQILNSSQAEDVGSARSFRWGCRWCSPNKLGISIVLPP